MLGSYPLGSQNRRLLGRSSLRVPQPCHLLAADAKVGRAGGLAENLASLPGGVGRQGPVGLGVALLFRG